MASHADDDLVPEETEGFKAGEKKTLAEYQQLAYTDTPHTDSHFKLARWKPEKEAQTADTPGTCMPYEEDEAMKRYKASLGLTSGNFVEDPNDPRELIIMSLGLEVAGRPDITIDLTGEKALEQLKKNTFIIKEGAEFRMKVKFRVQREILSGLSYVQSIKRAGLGLGDKSSEMIGSYSPNTTEKPFYEKKFNTETAPKGMMMRGKYNAKSRFIDDDKKTHLEFDWTFEIKKEWA